MANDCQKLLFLCQDNIPTLLESRVKYVPAAEGEGKHVGLITLVTEEKAVIVQWRLARTKGFRDWAFFIEDENVGAKPEEALARVMEVLCL